MQRSHSARVDKFNYYLNIKEVIRRTPTPTVSACAKHADLKKEIRQMNRQETKKETKEVVTVVRTWKTCDICESEITRYGCSIDEGYIEFREGDEWPEGHSVTTYRVDLCTDCFHGKVVPWLQSLGAAIQEKESS